MRIILTLTIALSALSLAPAATLTSGFIHNDASDASSPTLAMYSFGAPNLAINTTANTSFFLLPSVGSCNSVTCTYNFAFSDSSTLPRSGTVVYNGVSYLLGGGGPNTLTLTFTVSAPSVTVPESLSGSVPFQTESANWSSVPFTLSGTATLVSNSSTIFSMALTGSGIANASESAGGQLFGNFGSSVTYSITPEPSSVGMSITGLAGLVIALRRRSRQSQVTNPV